MKHLTLAGLDWIIPLVIVVVSLVQWAAQRKEKARQSGNQPKTASPLDHLDELMEALGQKQRPAPASPLPPPPQLKPVAQKTPQRTPVAKSSVATASVLKKKEEKSGEVGPLLKELKHLQKADLPRQEKRDSLEKTAPQQSLFQTRQLKESSKRKTLSELLKNRHRVRDAILINEILSSPVALKS
ncbi:MAG: hypothetical protein V1746_03165 [bacterium]